MFLKQMWYSANFIEMRNGCHQRGHSSLEKHQTFEFSQLVDFLRIFKNIAIFEIVEKIKNFPRKNLNPC